MSDRNAILIVDDESNVRDSLSKWFREDGYEIGTAENAAAALRCLQVRAWDVILLDIKMPGVDGMELQRRIRETGRDPAIIFITAHASVDTAVQALKSGAFDYITKPVDPDHLSHLVRNAIRQRSLSGENVKLKEHLTEFIKVDDLIGDSAAMKKVYELVERVAPADTTVMIRGESGTGKELIARAIHGNSLRKFFPIVTVNCGALPQGILESEIFGHERGAFTGAQYQRKGKLELADGGTLFLDEVGNVEMKTQMDLLRVIETKQFTRVGGNQVVKVDFRVICATNKDLEKAVADGTFREDLYYRLNVFTVVVPPLRERKSDIPLIAAYFVRKYAGVMGKTIDSISPDAMDLLIRYDWPGNVRELENAIERAIVVGKSSSILPGELPIQVNDRGKAPSGGSLAAIENEYIRRVLEENRWNISRSAEILQIDRATLYNKIERYGIPEAGVTPPINILSASSLVHPGELAAMARNVHAVFGLEAVPAHFEPDLRQAYDPARGQYNSTTLLSALPGGRARVPGKTLLLVDVDLFIPVLTFVFGEAEFDGGAAIVSTFRLASQFYGLPGSHTLLLARIEKEIIHELGHTFGLYHCHQFECVMRSSTYVEEIDIKKALPCPECASRLLGIYAAGTR